jgi:hypothetical protein
MSAFLHVPIGLATLRALRAQGPLMASDWARSAGSLAVFGLAGVLAPNMLAADKDSPYLLTKKEMGTYDIAEGEAEVRA